MTSMLTATFRGTSSVLQSYFLPEIMLDGGYDYSCAFLDLIIKTKDDAAIKNIVKSDVLRINCDVISDSYINGQCWHTIHQFATSASRVKDRILVEIPKNLNYYSIKLKNLNSLQISIVDNSGKLLDIDNVDIICRINIKRDSEKLL